MQSELDSRNDATELSLRGVLLAPAGFVEAWATHGPLDVRPCEPDFKLPLPAFRLSCPLRREDDAVRIEVVAGQLEDHSPKLVARVLWTRNARAARDYETALSTRDARSPHDYETAPSLAVRSEADWPAYAQALVLANEFSFVE